MIKKYLFLLYLLSGALFAFGQDITRKDADSMINALPESKGIARMELLLNLAQFHIFKPGELEKDFDSAIVYINEANILNTSIKSDAAYGYKVLTESYLMKEKGKKEEGKKLAEKAVQILETSSNKLYLGKAYYELSQYYDYYEDSDYQNKIALVKQALNAFQHAGNRERTAASLTLLGDLYCIKRDYPTAISTLNQALVVFDTMKYDKVQGVFVVLGRSYSGLGDDVKGLSYFLKALKTAQMVQDTSMQICSINNSLGALYYRIDNKEMSIKYWSNGLEIAKKYHDAYSILLLASNLTIAYNSYDQSYKSLSVLAPVSKSFAESDDSWERWLYNTAYFRTYLALKEYSKAQPYLTPLLRLLADSLLDDYSRSSIFRLLAEYYLETKQFAKARQYLSQNFEIVKNINYNLGHIQGYRFLYKLDSAEGNYQAAFNRFHYYKSKVDSMYAENKMKQLQVLGVEYETAMKEDSIRLKNKDISSLMQINSLQRANLRQESLIKNVTIIGIILAFIVIGLLYRQYRNKQKSNQMVTQKNEQLQHFLTEKEWLLKEIHHRVKNNLQIVMSLLNSQSVYIDNEPALAAIHNSQHRVHAMSLIHQKLYSSENLSSIDMSVYIRELISYLADSFDTGQRIRFDLHIESLEMDVSQAVPLGLVLNEAITNAIKYAFPNKSTGIITISLFNTSAQHYRLVISDDGVGIPASLTDKKAGSLGMSLMQGLSEDLNGSFSIENNNGTTVKISFVRDMGINHQSDLSSPIVSNN